MSDLRVNDVGVLISVNVHEDVDDASVLELLLQPPYGATKTVTASTDDTDSPRFVKYVTEDGVFDVDGRWQVQVRVVQTGKDRRSSAFGLTVGKALDV